MKKLFDAQSANGKSEPYRWSGGEGSLLFRGDFGSGDVTLEVAPPGRNPVDADFVSAGEYVAAGTYTAQLYAADGVANFKLPSGVWLRLNLQNSTNPDLNAWIAGNESQ